MVTTEWGRGRGTADAKQDTRVSGSGGRWKLSGDLITARRRKQGRDGIAAS